MAGSKLSFAVSALVEIYRAGNEGLVTAQDISKATGLSRRYLEQVLGLLTKSGIIRSVRGKRGGYQPVLSADKLHLADIWKAVREDITIPAAGAASQSSASQASGTRTFATLCDDLHGLVVEYMKSQTFKTIAQLDLEPQDMYYV
jgi:Rrf2 family protein